MEDQLIKVGITHGDINGIGYEIILKTFSDNRIAELCTPIIYGSAKIAAYHRKALGLPPVNISNIGKAEEAGTNRVNIISCVHDETKVELSKPTDIAAQAALKALDTAIEDLRRGAIDVLLTAPANGIQSNDRYFAGHTEYLEESFGGKNKSLSMFVNGNLRVALCTGHIPLAEVAPTITQDNIVAKLEALNHSLIQDFNIVRPRIAVLSLNPYNGSDTGLVGDEEERIIKPAMAEVEKRGMTVFGPYAADTYFGTQKYEDFDGVLAMYHDQGIVPFKTLAVENGLLFSAGLPIVHTAPAHGAAFDIAGQNLASEESFRQALYAALDIFRNRQLYKEANRNPLRKQYYDRGGGEEKLDLTKDAEDETL